MISKACRWTIWKATGKEETVPKKRIRVPRRKVQIINSAVIATWLYFFLIHKHLISTVCFTSRHFEDAGCRLQSAQHHFSHWAASVLFQVVLMGYQYQLIHHSLPKEWAYDPVWVNYGRPCTSQTTVIGSGMSREPNWGWLELISVHSGNFIGNL